MSSEEEIILFQFFIKFCQKLEQGENIVCSPLSVGRILALLALASEGQGRKEILDVFGVPNYGKIQKLFRKTPIPLKSRRGIFLTVANKIYIRDDLEVINVVVREAKTTCETSIEKISFVDPHRAQATINAWVNKKTKNKIPDMFSPNEFTNYTCFVLVNAIYFSGTWKNQFNPMKTKPGIFLVDATTTSTVPMMNSEAEFRYGNSDALKAKMLEMPYDAGDATSLVVLPDEIEGLKDLLEKLSEGYNLMPEIQRMNNKKLRVSIPRFKVETEIDLVDYLPKIGISSIFGENFGLSRFVNSSQPLVISKAVQRTVAEFNERGFRAASATSLQVRPIHEEFFDEFLADHPFLVITFIQQLPYFFILYYGAGHDSHSESELEIKKKRCVIS